MHNLITHRTRIVRMVGMAALWLMTFLVMLVVTLSAFEVIGVAHASVR